MTTTDASTISGTVQVNGVWLRWTRSASTPLTESITYRPFLRARDVCCSRCGSAPGAPCLTTGKRPRTDHGERQDWWLCGIPWLLIRGHRFICHANVFGVSWQGYANSHLEAIEIGTALFVIFLQVVDATKCPW